MAPGRDRVALDPCRSGREREASHGANTFRRVSGPTADELFLLCRPGSGVASAARQAETIYESMLQVLTSEGVGPEALVSETVFFGRIREDVQSVLDGRRRVLGRAGIHGCRPAITLIGQPPLSSEEARVEVAAVAVIPHRPESFPAADASRVLSCSCDACKAGAHARVVRIGEQSHFRSGNIYGVGPGAFEQAYDMFRVAEGLLSEAEMTFGDVIRTWIYLRDIERDYDVLNKARQEFFRRGGIERRPVSTGIQGIPCADAHDFSMSLHAVKSPRPLDIAVVSSPTLNEAWTYGAEFSRGLRLVDASKVTLHVSGTASIDEAGRTVHVGDFEAQVERMLHNIASLLAAQGANFNDVVSAVTYLKNPSDAPAIREMFRSRGFNGFPCALVQAPLCRPELLCETEAVAMVPLARSGA